MNLNINVTYTKWKNIASHNITLKENLKENNLTRVDLNSKP